MEKTKCPACQEGISISFMNKFTGRLQCASCLRSLRIKRDESCDLVMIAVVLIALLFENFIIGVSLLLCFHFIICLCFDWLLGQGFIKIVEKKVKGTASIKN